MNEPPKLLALRASWFRSQAVTPAERSAYEALDNLSLTWQRRATKLKQSATKTIQGGVTLEQLRREHAANRRTD